ncbi:MAG: phospho-N-acetylmuramoyl-pentapeptide-transferase [Alistipes sp.]|nr:phospho-N-acetylmuramoyl-pentapeptide-transferase [Alistipes sp.]MBO5399881.1 phospho-N-acetylmuramoyl-pentapeptide-transferase [Alistipes sp.]MBP3474347.1 phospho-N-acetylmuramoyl-pentapeptide-transferase [Alistipes sp.]MBQ4539871.1 phospho-N-acetylmuramoyl-pentapeptide-transferase [Alistipes sp.]MBR3792795.1 phospho-N-acetylmuramoyl-pentapeptide-transferase [Alistipes sp.]
MLYPIFQFLDEHYDLPGAGVFQYISFRSAVAVILALLITILFGRTIIRALQRHQIGEEIRDLGLEGQLSKRGTPTMGGVIILLAVLLPIVLLGRLDNVYVQLMIISTVWLGVLGFLDDYIKIFRHNKDGLKGKFKIVGQVGLGVIVGTVMCFSQDVVIREKVSSPEVISVSQTGYATVEQPASVVLSPTAQKTTKTTIPFVKDNEFDYGWLVGGNDFLTWLLYIAVAIFVVTAVSNGANLTDGLDGLLTTVSVPIMLVLGALAYLSGHIIYADYLNIMYIPESAELVVFAAAMCGALLGFLWYNSFPAQIFMGDTGSLSIGGIIAVFALCIRKELLLPLMCGIFLAEAVSVMVQVGWFKYTKRKYGEGRRVLLMSPLHHHYQKKGLFETKIVMRFFIVSILLCALTLVTLKIR